MTRKPAEVGLLHQFWFNFLFVLISLDQDFPAASGTSSFAHWLN